MGTRTRFAAAVLHQRVKITRGDDKTCRESAEPPEHGNGSTREPMVPGRGARCAAARVRSAGARETTALAASAELGSRDRADQSRRPPSPPDLTISEPGSDLVRPFRNVFRFGQRGEKNLAPNRAVSHRVRPGFADGVPRLRVAATSSPRGATIGAMRNLMRLSPWTPVRCGGVRPHSDLPLRRGVRRGRQPDDARTAGSAARAPGAGPHPGGSGNRTGVCFIRIYDETGGCFSTNVERSTRSHPIFLPRAPCQPGASPPPGGPAALGAHPGSTTALLPPTRCERGALVRLGCPRNSASHPPLLRAASGGRPTDCGRGSHLDRGLRIRLLSPGATVAGVSDGSLGAATPQHAAALQERAEPEQEDREHDHRKGKEDDYEGLKHPRLILPPAGAWHSGFASAEVA